MKFIGFIFSFLLFAACNNSSLKDDRDKAKADSILHSSIYPQEIIKKHFEKKYDNAVWLLYASNFHAKGVVLLGKNYQRDTIYKDTSIISFYPYLRGISDYGDDTIYFEMWFTTSDGKYWCFSSQKKEYIIFGFLKNSDSIIYRMTGEGWMPFKDMKGFMWNKNDSIEMEAIIKNHQPSKVGHSKNYPIFDRLDGFYPLDEQNELFIQYLKTHKKQISPPLMRLCKERKIF